MGLKEQIDRDLKEAMRSGDKTRKLALRSLKTAMLNAEKSGEKAHELSDQEIVSIIMKEVKQRRDSIEEYRKGGREDLAADEEAEMKVLGAYLPKMMTEKEIEVKAREVIARVGAQDLHDIGKVMKPLMAELRGKADGAVANKVVRDLLSGRS